MTIHVCVDDKLTT